MQKRENDYPITKLFIIYVHNTNTLLILTTYDRMLGY